MRRKERKGVERKDNEAGSTMGKVTGGLTEGRFTISPG